MRKKKPIGPIVLIAIFGAAVVGTAVLTATYIGYRRGVASKSFQLSVRKDRFAFQIKYIDRRHIDGTIDVWVYEGNRQIYYYILRHSISFKLPEIEKVYDESGVLCYEWNGWGGNFFLTYRTAPDAEFRPFPPNMDSKGELSKEDEKILLPVARERFKTGNFGDIKLFGEFLIRRGDPTAVSTIKRLASSSFTSSETAVGKGRYGNLTYIDMYNFSKDLIKKYHIK